MISQTIARRYAQALLSLGQEDGNFAQYGEDLAQFTKAMQIPELAESLSNPIYPKAVRRKVLDQVLAKMGLSKIATNFLGLLQDKGRISHVGAINDRYQQLVDEVNNIKRATVTAAGPLSKAIQDKIKATLEEMTGKSIVLTAVANPDIIGGVVAQVGDLTLDGSVKTQLKNLKESLIKG